MKKYPSDRGVEVEHRVSEWLEEKGWGIEDRPQQSGTANSALAAQNQGKRFIVEVKALSEGRPDRAIPLLSQAILQAQSHSTRDKSAKPLAMLYVERASLSLYDSVLDFANRYAPEMAVGVLSSNGLGVLKKGGSDTLLVDDREEFARHSRVQRQQSGSSKHINLFSDLNQWMLKIFLASEIPDYWLNAPRARFSTGAELAAAANVSEMSASRFLQQLRQETFLDETSGYMRLVRREELFARWRSAARRSTAETPMRFLFKSSIADQLTQLANAQQDEACLGLFAAADALQLGHVSGVPPHVCVAKLPVIGNASQRASQRWDMVMPASEVSPDFILRQSATPQSMMRGALRRDGLLISDAIQIWLDVSSHPARGEEQADLIYRKVLEPLV